MASLERINEVLKKVANFISPLLPLASCHMVDYITHNHWENLVPEQIREDLSNLSREELQQIPSASLWIETGNACVDSNWSLETSSLPSYLTAIRQHSLPSLGVLTPIDEILVIYGPSEVTTFPMKGVMSKKKTHEVETMSRVISRLAKGCGVDWIIDIGSGKGYLSTSLTLQYNLNVIAIDSSQENTSNAMVRKTKLQKFWRSLRKTEEDKLLGRPLKKGKHRRRRIKPLEEVNNGISGAKSPDTSMSQCNWDNSSKHIAVTAFITEDTNLLKVVKESIENDSRNVCGISNVPLSDEIASSTIVGSQNYCSSKNYDVDDDLEHKSCDMLGGSDTRRIQADKECSKLVKEDVETKNYRHHDLHDNKSSLICDKWSDINTLGLVGLHTCGNLAPSSMKIFLSNPTLAFLCNVGCCYHLMEEEFSQNPFIDYDKKKRDELLKHLKPEVDSINQVKENSVSNDIPPNPMHPSKIHNLSLGFPLSKVLREEQFSLGRNSRMLSCQSPDRLNCKDLSSTMSLYWRSLLQVLLLNKIGNVSDMAHVGRIAAKCQNFTDYARAAFAKLGIDIEIDEEELHDYDRKYGSHIKKLEMFFLFRSSLAPIIEGLILMDRLAYLHEQGIESAYLVQLFDPVTSPRCHALVAFRNHLALT